VSPGTPAASALELSAAAARARHHLEDCLLCPFRCGAVRSTGQGVCRVSSVSYIAREMLHLGEETPLRPAHAIFFSGCTATCRFCVAASFAFRPTYGVPSTPAQLAQRIRLRQEQGARSICFIGGDPVPHIPFILETLAVLGPDRRVPVVFNSNFYMSPQALELLAPAVDIYLPDLKFGPGSGLESCGERLGGMPNYWAVVTGCIQEVWARGARVMVRHLLMPGHWSCCTEPVLHWLAERPGLEVSLLDQYVPPVRAQGRLAGFLAPEEGARARALARRLRLSLVG